ncbi:uncharacterized protein LOC111402846 [Olea europaea var. sylvestris]|uniref:uncharacterized protein LOC111402846 n=1 Tax=Olea europaea var. sylvestris TaxID=158386 RepID=UPI000C1D4AF9|nr:uncharacterized protein LOC111402846 [Olea europaea var. sylvestris]
MPFVVATLDGLRDLVLALEGLRDLGKTKRLWDYMGWLLEPVLEDFDAGNINTDQIQTQNSNVNQSGNPSNIVNHDPTQPNSPYFIGSNDNTGAMLVTHTLDANNYHSWARSLKRALRIKNKLAFIDGSLKEPADPNDPLMEHWLRCNDIVITWMQNTIAVDIKCSTTYAETAHQLWIELEQHFAQQNTPRIFEIKQAISMLLQNEKPVSVYLSKFKTLLDELMNYEAVPNCSCGSSKIVIQNQQRDWVIKFLMGLNDSYKGIKAQILLIKPFPILNEVYSIIQQEEKMREISTEGSSHESMALLARGSFKEKGKKILKGGIDTTAHFAKFQGIHLKDVSKQIQTNQFALIVKFLAI